MMLYCGALWLSCLLSFCQRWHCAEAVVEAQLALNPGGSLYEESIGSIQACVELGGAPTGDATLTLRTTPGTAGTDDFETVTEMYPFTPTSNLTMCVDITIVDDSMSETIEEFTIMLSSDNALVTVTTPQTQVLIADDDGDSSRLVLKQSAYTVSESADTVELCVVLLGGTAGLGVEFNVITQDGTAGALDYVFLGLVQSIPPGQLQRCGIFVTIGGDTDIEEDEYFTVSLASLFAETVGSSTVFIVDDDGVNLVLAATEVSEIEGNNGMNTTVNVCIELSSSDSGDLLRDVEVTLNTIEGSADMNDFVTLTGQSLIIPSTTSLDATVCYPVTVIHGDDIMENNETFMVVFSPLDIDDVIVGPDSVTVTIIDDGDVIKDCGALPNPSNGLVSLGSTTEGSKANYSCNTGYNLTGDSMRVCASSGNWSGTEPVCEIVDCGPQIAPTNGNVSFDDTVFESVVSYSCDPGYVLTGDSTQTCQENGQWSGSDLSCDDVDECVVSNGGCEHICVNTDGSHHCDCNTGFQLSSAFDCSDFDECESENDTFCDSNAICTNTVGSFTCACNDGYFGDGINCTARCTRVFQLLLMDVNGCDSWRFIDTEDKLNDITNAILARALRDGCQSNDCPPLGQVEISMEEFACDLMSDFDNKVLYRAQISSNDENDCSQLISRIHVWVQATASISVQGNRLFLDPMCTLEIDSFDELPECPTSPDPEEDEDDDLTIIIAAGAGGGGFLLLCICVVVVIVACCVTKSRKKKPRKMSDYPEHTLDPNPAYAVTKNPYEYNLGLQSSSFAPALPPPRGSNTIPRDYRDVSPYLNMSPAPISISMNLLDEDGNYDKIDDLLPQITAHNPLYDRPSNSTLVRDQK